MAKEKQLVEMKPVYEEMIDPKDYLALTDSEKSTIESARIITPSLGDGTFGKIMIRYRFPIFKNAA